MEGLNSSLPTQGGKEGLNKSLPTQGGLEGLFFELLQIAIGNRKELTRQLTDDEWETLYGICEKQALLGIAFAGVERLPKEQCPPFEVLAEWVHDAQVAKDRNERLNEECEALTRRLERDGFGSCILKGQSNQVNYPEHLKDYRTAGDIDVWLMPKGKETLSLNRRRRAIMKYVMAKVGDQRVIYHHVDFPVMNTEVEIHFTPSWMKNPFHNRRMQKYFEYEWNNIEKTDYGFYIPSASLNVVYQLTHIYRHLFNEGIGLRQIIDYYFVLQKVRDERLEVRRPPLSPCVGGEDRENRLEVRDKSLEVRDERLEIMRVIERLGLKTFASAVMWVIQEVLDPKESSSQTDTDWKERWPWMICKPNENAGRFLLSEILQAGNFGRYDERANGEYNTGTLSHTIYKIKRNIRLFVNFPSEVLWAGYFFVLQNYGFWRMGLKNS